MLNEEQVRGILLDNDYLSNQNSNYRSYCQDLADFCLPRKAWINSIRTKGERVKFNFLYDSTAIGAVRDTAAGFCTYLVNQTSRWFAIVYRDKELMKRYDVRTFCKDVEDWCLSKLNDSNFYNTALEWFTDKVAFGTGTFTMLSDPKKFVSFNEVPVGQVNRVVDANGQLCGLYRNFRWSARNAFKVWGKGAGETVMELLKSKPFEEVEFLHYVGERYLREAGKEDSGNMPYESVWIGKKDKHVISESGFMEMPYISEVFYRDENDSNGFSPTMDCFAEIKLVNAMFRTVIRGAMKQADPPLIMPSRGLVLPLNLNPAAMNYRDAKTPHDALQALPFGQGRIDIGVDLIKLVQEKIQNRMFVHLFQSLNEVTKQMTVLETQTRIAQSMALLGPVVNRDTNALGLMIQRLINMGARDPMSGFPEMPEGLEKETYDLVYLSPLAKAQRQAEVQEIRMFLNDVAGIGAVMPRAYGKVDEDKTVDVIHRVSGITPEILRDEDELVRMRKHEEEQQAIMASLQLAGAGSEVALKGSQANKTQKEAEAVGRK